ncbi:DMT family transporter [Erysipelothrix urinaevulpis]|uniref:DMT family transporter n=1 Tax=Erysipelothrix urinaevulpis TaxID=2683717 RepID=UPI001356BDF6|nr:DMT family transporter [Erysipelothrix urinaevulpis]
MLKKKAYLSIFLAAMIWGGGFVATSYALEQIPAMATLAIRFTLSAIVLFIFGYKTILKAHKDELIKTAPLGIFLFLAFYFQTIGNAATTVSNNSFLTALNVVFTPFIASVILKTKTDRKDYLASLLALLGVALLTMSSVNLSFNMGDLYSLIGAVFFALHVVFSSKAKDVGTLLTTFMQMVVAGMISLVASLIIDDYSFLATLNLSSVVSIGYLVIFSTLIAYLLQLFASKTLSPTALSVVLSTEALFATLFGIILLGEKITVKSGISMGLLMLAVVMSSSKKSNV